MTGSDPRCTLRLLGGLPKGDNSTYPFGVPQTCGVGGIERIGEVPIFARTPVASSMDVADHYSFVWKPARGCFNAGNLEPSRLVSERFKKPFSKGRTKAPKRRPRLVETLGWLQSV